MKKLAAAMCGLLLFVFFSCNTSDLFEEYRGVNLISAYGFDSASWTAERTESYYMNFESVTAAEAGTTSGLPSGAAIYRLEIPNLMPDGDFEATAADVGALPAGWSEVLPVTADEVISSGIYGQSLSYDTFDATELLYFDLSTIADSFSPNQFYLIRFVLNQTAAVFDYHNGSGTQLLKPWTLSGLSGITSFPTAQDDAEIRSVTNGTFSVNDLSGSSGGNQNGELDNFRIVRTDISNRITLNVPYQEAGRLDLLSGTYRFSVYIKQEPAANISPTVQNRFQAAGVTLIAEGTPDFVSSGYAYAAYHPDDDGADWTSWTQISVDIDNLNPSSQPNRGIDLYVTPNDIDDKDIGSLLIAAPSLEFIPGG